ncbi:hypothetical protein GDO78_006616 [Eleutherodactylus coqui]|uniref:Uncharacterized protein n=1 Tax=Eleutherodactylus coqui TaxID=57060 RepID=A0A8J6FEN7_ELECQ|nr:hypothetical protein GDO78_006616 [Eleutherodactylus coqui]
MKVHFQECNRSIALTLQASEDSLHSASIFTWTQKQSWAPMWSFTSFHETKGSPKGVQASGLGHTGRRCCAISVRTLWKICMNL